MRLPLVSPFETSFGREVAKDALLIAIRKDDMVAYGECVAGSGPWYNEETIVTAKHIITEFLAPVLFEKQLETPEEFIEKTAGIRRNNMAVAAVEMALWDLHGKLKSKPLSGLLGGRKKEVPVGVSVGIQPSSRKLVEVVSTYLKEGYRRIKVKIKPGYDIEPVKAVRREFPEIMLQVDANSAYTLEDSGLLKGLDEFNLLLIEQPLGYDDIVDHSKLQKLLKTPICLDESIHSPSDGRRAIEIGACKVINIKPGRMRGLTKSKELHDICVDSGVPVWCGGMLETGIGRAFNVALATLPGFTLPGDISASKRYFHRDLIKQEFTLTERSTLEVPDGPGIGVEVDQKLLDSSTIARKVLTRGK